MSTDVRVLTIGSATQDVFLIGDAFTAQREERLHEYMEEFPLGAKIGVDKVHFDTGGNASNAAVTFARQGFKVGFIGKVGNDIAAAEVLRVFQLEGIDVDHLAHDPKLSTDFAVILLAPNGERTVLIYHGASHNMQTRDFAFKNLKADWFYMSSMAGNLNMLAKFLNHATSSGIQVAYNPGTSELKHPRQLRPVLSMVDVLMLNRDELLGLYETSDHRDALRQATRAARIVVMTDGPGGVWATDGAQLYEAGLYQKVKVVDRTGAGDAFGSGFVAALAKGRSIPDAITFGSANSTSVVTKIGAKTGILRTDRVKRMNVKVSQL